MAKGLFLAFTNCTDEARHEEFNRWYTHTHLPDLSKAQGFVRARRYVNLAPERGPAQYLAAYEFEGEDLRACVDDLRRIAQWTFTVGRHIDCLTAGPLPLYREIEPREYRPLERVAYPSYSLDVRRWEAPRAKLPAATLPKAVLLVFTECADPKRDEEFNRWYSHTHLPDLVKAEGVVGARRYRNTRPGDGSATYLAAYELAAADLGEAMRGFLDVAARTFPSHHIDCLKGAGGGGLFQEIDGRAYRPLEQVAYPRTER